MSTTNKHLNDINSIARMIVPHEGHIPRDTLLQELNTATHLTLSAAQLSRRLKILGYTVKATKRNGHVYQGIYRS